MDGVQPTYTQSMCPTTLEDYRGCWSSRQSDSWKNIWQIDADTKQQSSKILMLQELLLVVGAFYILFFTAIFYVRLNFSITKDTAAEARMKVACITEQVLTLVNKRLGLYRHFDEVVSKYKQSRDISTLNSGKKTLETEHKALTNEVASLQSKLKTEGSDMCVKVSEIQKLGSQVKELVLKSSVEAERLVVGKLKKDTYIENEKLHSNKHQELVTKIDNILDAL
ncbi:dolichyl-diphosphooligosaccharide--protein glycosyltransferase subunit 1-like [Chelonia mydas]|uniref:dolichyl-diphosphooligosaccharide--protein glycosyltransferase subunit 1-like n=1 Tax=Chelonia mydas TaxID=8469 RepID=UPI0018A1C441|nr:dolichyl-diphosphooligosaccharide--protein glycosyltransferase subunit 1-like [Chelonia mydas]